MEVTDLKRRLKIKEDLLEKLDIKNNELYNENLRLQKDKENLEKEKNDALSRLSELAGQRLTNGNPDITDLSDPNRPAKIAERWSSLYTDEWTDAYEAIKDRNKRTNDDLEPEKELLQIVDCCYQTCKEKVEYLNKTINEILWDLVKQIHFLGLESSPIDPNARLNQQCARENQVLVEAMQPFMEQATNQRRSSSSLTHSIINECYVNYSKSIISVSSEKENRFVKKCSELCLIMCTQEPPMKLEYKGLEDQTIDCNKFNHYSRQGKIVQSVIWPVLLLYKGGPVLAKGTVQTYREKGTKVETIDQKPRDSYECKQQSTAIPEVEKYLPQIVGGKHSANITNDEQQLQLRRLDEGEQQSTEIKKSVNHSTDMVTGDKKSIELSECKQQFDDSFEDENYSPENTGGKQLSTDSPDAAKLLKIDEREQQSTEIMKNVSHCTDMVAVDKKSLEIYESKHQSTNIHESEKQSSVIVDRKQSEKGTNDEQTWPQKDEREKQSIEIKKCVLQSSTELVAGDMKSLKISECKQQSNDIPVVEKYFPDIVDEKTSAEDLSDEQKLPQMHEGEEQLTEEKSVNQFIEIVAKAKTSLEISKSKQQSTDIPRVEAKSSKIDVEKQGSETLLLEISECKKQSTDISEGAAQSPEKDVGKQPTKVTNDEQKLLKINEGEQQSEEIEKSVHQCTEIVEGNKTPLEISDCKQQSTKIPEVEVKSREISVGKQTIKVTNDEQKLLQMGEGEQQSAEIKKSVNPCTEMVEANTSLESSDSKQQLTDIQEAEKYSPDYVGGKQKIEDTLSANTERTPKGGDKYEINHRIDNDRNDKEIGKESEFEKDENESEMHEKCDGYLRNEALSE